MKNRIIVTPAVLVDEMGEEVVVVDVRPPHFYNQGHIPGAVNFPAFLLPAPGGGGLPCSALAARLGALGIAPEDSLVIYDEGGSPASAALFRLLSTCGHQSASVLDGGMARWSHEDRPVEREPSVRQARAYSISRAGERVQLTTEDLLVARDDPDTVIVDVRHASEYAGLQRTAARNGHIPGAVHMDWSSNLTQSQENVPVMGESDQLREQYEALGVKPNKRIVLYCQSGNRASHTYLVLKHLGYQNVSVYLPGWQEWGNRFDTPVEEP